MLQRPKHGDPPLPTHRSPISRPSLTAIYIDLRRHARALLARERWAQTLQPTALLHEAWLRLLRTVNKPWQSDRHVAGAAVEAMRRILVERARKAKAVRHGGALHRTLVDEGHLPAPSKEDWVLALDRALEHLERIQPRQAEVVKHRYFVGLSIEETAKVMGISVGTVKNDWCFARAWLGREISRSSSSLAPHRLANSQYGRPTQQ